MAREWTKKNIEELIADYLRRHLKKLVEEIINGGTENVE